jgi:hypothetical protein
MLLAEPAGMELDRDVVVQVGISVAVVGLFILGLGIVSAVFGSAETVDDRPLNGTLEDGSFTGTVTDGRVNGTVDGRFDNGVELTIQGEFNGTHDNGTAEGEFNGSVGGAIDGRLNGTVVNGTLELDDGRGEDVQGTLEGEFDGSATGTTATDLSETGALVLLGLMVAFILGMSLSGFLIERLREAT